MALDRASMGCVKIKFALVGIGRSPGACATVARERDLYERCDKLQTAQLATYTGYVLDEGALPDGLRANCHYLRQTQFECSPTILQREVIVIETDSPMGS